MEIEELEARDVIVTSGGNKCLKVPGGAELQVASVDAYNEGADSVTADTDWVPVE